MPAVQALLFSHRLFASSIKFFLLVSDDREDRNFGKSRRSLCPQSTLGPAGFAVALPGMDGYEAAVEIRRRERGERRTPVVAMTAHAMKGHRERCLAAGMDDHIGKPVTKAFLAEILEKYLRRESCAAGQSRATRPGAEKPVEVERLQLIADGDLDFERELIDLYLSDMEPRLSSLELCVQRQDAEGLRHEAHAVKGSSGNAGARGMQHLAQQLETMGASGEMACAPEVLSSLLAEFREVGYFLRAYRKSLGTPRISKVN